MPKSKEKTLSNLRPGAGDKESGILCRKGTFLPHGRKKGGGRRNETGESRNFRPSPECEKRYLQKMTRNRTWMSSFVLFSMLCRCPLWQTMQSPSFSVCGTPSSVTLAVPFSIW